MILNSAAPRANDAKRQRDDHAEHENRRYRHGAIVERVADAFEDEAIGECATPVVESRELGRRKDPVMLEAEIEQPDDRERHEESKRRQGSAPGTHTQLNCGASPRESAVFGVRPPTVGNETSPLPSTRSLKRSDWAARRKLPAPHSFEGAGHHASLLMMSPICPIASLPLRLPRYAFSATGQICCSIVRIFGCGCTPFTRGTNSFWIFCMAGLSA